MAAEREIAEGQTVRELKSQLAAAMAERDKLQQAQAALLKESLDQQMAATEVLQVINSSPGQLTPVFEAMLEKAMTLCGASFGFLTVYDGQHFSPAAMRGVPAALASYFSAGMDQPRPGDAHTRLLEGEDIVHNLDQKDEEAYRSSSPLRRAVVDLGGARTALVIALRKHKLLLGALTIYRKEVRPFSDKEIALMQNFAAQAVIAMENARLLTETREALEQQTASDEILQVISQSPTDVQPVFDAVAKAAVRLCGAQDSLIAMCAGSEVVFEAHEGHVGGELRSRWAINPQNAMGYAILEGRTVHIPDATALKPDEFTLTQEGSRLFGFKAIVAAPMIREGSAIGALLLRKPDPGPFTPRQIKLLETFAAQAVIAIENVRLFTGLRESLEQQTATAEILRVISQSPTDVGPVLTAVAKAALKFCGARDAQVGLRDGDSWSVAAHEGPIGALSGTRQLTRQTAPGRAMVDGTVVQIADLQSAEADEYLEGRELGERLGFRSALAAPLLRDDVAIGAISLRRPEPGAFTPNQVELLKSFADQAVIAIENVRLFTELKESLDQQTATAEILRAISQSPTDVQPVLDVVARAARRFCGADDVVIGLREGDELRIAAHEGPLRAPSTRRRLDRSSSQGRAIIDRRTVHNPDLTKLDPVEWAKGIELALEFGFKASLVVPMLRDGVGIGTILLRRPEIGPFAPRQIKLLEIFAAQAVIAIENVRLFTELRDSLERLKAAQANLVQSEKMASLGQLTAGIAHEIKNPLNFVNNFAGLSVELLDELKQAVDALLAEPDEDKRAELQDTMDLLTGNLAKIAEHGKRADGIVKSMLSHSRGGAGDWQESNINTLVEEALNLAYHGARAQDNEFNVTLERDFAPESKPIELVPQDITRVFLNLFGNGFYAANKRRLGHVAGYRPSLKVSTRDQGDAVEIRVRDNGTGIPDEVRDKLFQPFFTTKPTGEGTGLGLSISYDIVTQQHGGTIEVESEPGSFTEFTVRLPRRRRAAQPGGA